jgi:hypothetical protein
MRDTELYEGLLGLKVPWRVKAVKMDVEGRRVEVEVACAQRTIWGELKFLDHPHGSVMKSLKVSVNALPASQDETLPDKLLAHIAPLGSDHISVCFRSQDGR